VTPVAGRRRPPVRAVVAAAATVIAAAVLLVGLHPDLQVLHRDRPAPPPVPVANAAFHSTGSPVQAVTVWAVGDGAADTPFARDLAAMIAARRPARLLYLGDVYESGTSKQFRDHVRGVYGRLVTRTLPTPGNHEWPNHPKGYDRFWREVTGAPTPPWYAVTIGAWQVLSLNSEAPHARDGAQLRWLRRQLGRGFQCRLAMWHRPRFSAGTHGDQPDTAPLWDAVQGRAALVLNGHDHDLQRLRPIEGTTEIVAGAGGKDHYAIDRQDARLAFADDTHVAALRIVLKPDRATVAFVDRGGQILDRADVSCPR
jgi:acid phosphatase type 7